MRTAALLGLVAAAGLCTGCAQTPPKGDNAKTPGREELAGDPPLFLSAARTALKWDAPAETVHMIGPIYFVGTRGLASFLITGSQGHVLMYTGMPGSGELIERSIIRLGFNPRDVKLILTGHAHTDHAGGHAYLKRATGAKIAMMAEEVPLFESGGAADFHYGAFSEFRFEPAKVDQVFHDGDEVRLGDIVIKALLTPGHTKGSTTYVMSIADSGRVYTVVFPDGTSVNPGYRLVVDPSYPRIADNYRRTFTILDRLSPDVWLNPHNEMYGFDEKLRRQAAGESAAAWVDPDGYRRFIAMQREKFEAQERTERGDAGSSVKSGPR